MLNTNIKDILKENQSLLKKLAVLFVVLIIIDQITKIIAQNYLEYQPDIVLLPGLVSLHFIRNEIPHLHQYIIYFILNIIIMPVVVFYALKEKYWKVLTAGLVILWSAVFSNNIIDAFTLGYIRDFIQLRGIATGNIADQYRTIGIVIILIGMFKKNEEKFSTKTLVMIILTIILSLVLMMLFWRYLARFMAI